MTQNKQLLNVYTDGSCSGNPGPGGWGFCIAENGRRVSGHHPGTTNNRMEMTAALKALEHIASEEGKDCPVIIYTDSAYLQQGMTLWLKGWKAKGWKGSNGNPVLNQDLWKKLDDLATGFASLAWEKVKGHAGVEGNEIADQLAKDASMGVEINTADCQASSDIPNQGALSVQELLALVLDLQSRVEALERA